jgi:hypothetical protein
MKSKECGKCLHTATLLEQQANLERKTLGNQNADRLLRDIYGASKNKLEAAMHFCIGWMHKTDQSLAAAFCTCIFH